MIIAKKQGKKTEKKKKPKIKKVKIYSTSVCPWCAKTKAFLKEHSIPFEDVNVGEDAEARNEMMEKSGQLGVPVIDIDGDIVIGFDKHRLAELLGISA